MYKVEIIDGIDQWLDNYIDGQIGSVENFAWTGNTEFKVDSLADAFRWLMNTQGLSGDPGDYFKVDEVTDEYTSMLFEWSTDIEGLPLTDDDWEAYHENKINICSYQVKLHISEIKCMNVPLSDLKSLGIEE